MEKKAYKILGSFECCGKSMVVVGVNGKVACVMPEIEYNKIIEAERKYRQRKRWVD